MKHKSVLFLYLLSCLINTPSLAESATTLPQGFVYLSDVEPTIIQSIRYATSNNFVGQPIKGYFAPRCIVTCDTALALAKLQKELLKHNLSLKVFDCYRPTTAVSHFLKWSKNNNDQKQKNEYYPNINKADFFKLGYVAERSGHSRGSTVDLTLIDLQGRSAKELEMGTSFDFMDEASHFNNLGVSETARTNRVYLRTVLAKNGFAPYEGEWWHFTLKKEPFPSTYFNFPVE